MFWKKTKSIFDSSYCPFLSPVFHHQQHHDHKFAMCTFPLVHSLSLDHLPLFDLYHIAVDHSHWIDVQHWKTSFSQLLQLQVQISAVHVGYHVLSDESSTLFSNDHWQKKSHQMSFCSIHFIRMIYIYYSKREKATIIMPMTYKSKHYVCVYVDI